MIPSVKVNTSIRNEILNIGMETSGQILTNWGHQTPKFCRVFLSVEIDFPEEVNIFFA